MILLNEIFEYDIEHAGPSILYENKKISKELYEELISLPKDKRVVKTGLLIRDNPDFYNVIQEGYDFMTKKFIRINKLKPHHVVEVVHDAIWVTGVSPKVLEFNNCRFRKKRYFNLMFIYDKKHIRFYLNIATDELDVRGGSVNPNSKLIKPFKSLLKSFEFNSTKIYEKIHIMIKKLEKDKDAYGEEMVKGVSNLSLLKSLLFEIVR